jgi:hypothetical protein
MKYITFLFAPLLAIVTIFAVSCSDNTNSMGPSSTTSDLTLSINGLTDLGPNAMYEGWIIVNGDPISTGKFSVDVNGDLSATTFSLDQSDLNNATAFVLTVEPEPDPDPAPSNSHLMAGAFSSDVAALMVGNSAALGNDFTSATGSYILATPTNGTESNEDSGIWFLDISSGMPMMSLNLPTLPSGWMYEGWAVINGVPVTTGKFSSVDMSDENAPYSGTMPAPPFPGEDFLMNAPMNLTFPTNLSGATAVITVEPDPDNSTSPFLLKPLVGMIPSQAMDHVDYTMNLNLSSFPTGSASRVSSSGNSGGY